MKDTTETIYLEPDGSAVWTVLEENVRSDDNRLEDRGQEEADFMAAVAAERHPMMLALDTLTPTGVRTVLLRPDRPYTVYTEARFARFDDLMVRLAEEIGVEFDHEVEATSVVKRHGHLVTWTLTLLEHPHDPDSGAAIAAGRPLDALIDSFDHCRFVLAVGHFTSAVGFEISGDGRIATFHYPDQKADGEAAARRDLPPLSFSLAWTIDQ